MPIAGPFIPSGGIVTPNELLDRFQVRCSGSRRCFMVQSATQLCITFRHGSLFFDRKALLPSASEAFQRARHRERLLGMQSTGALLDNGA